MPLLQPGLRFRLGLQQPLAIEIKPVVIGPRRRPQIVLFVIGIRHPDIAAEGLDMIDPARMAIRIEDGGDQDDAVVQGRLNLGSLRSGEVVECRDGCIHASGLGAMDTIVQPQDGGAITDRRARLERGQVLGPDVVDTRMVFRRGDDKEQDRAPLMGVADRLDRDAVGPVGDFRKIGHQLVMTYRAVADPPSDHILRRGHVRVIVDALDLEEFDRLGQGHAAQATDHQAGPEQGVLECACTGHRLPLVILDSACARG